MTSKMDAKPFLWLVAMSKHNVKLVKRLRNLVGQYPMTYCFCQHSGNTIQIRSKSNNLSGQF